MRRDRRRERGIALLLVLWVFMLLGVIALDFSSYMRDDAMAAVNLAEETRGYYVALAGMNRGMLDWVQWREHQSELAERAASPEGATPPATDEEEETGPLVPPDGAWHEGDFQGGRWAVRMTDEQSRIPLNPLCRARGENDEPARTVLSRVVRYLVAGGGTATGIGRDEAAEIDTVVDSILDWCDSDKARHSKGAETAYYEKLEPPYTAKNGPLDSPEELLLVRGVTPQLFYGSGAVPGLRDIFSFYIRSPQYGKLNVRFMQPKVLEALLGGPDEALSLLAEQQEGDALLQPLIAKLNEIFPTLGDNLVEDVEPRVVVIEAKGDVSNERNQSRVAAVAELSGGGELPHIKRWFDRAPWEGGLPAAPVEPQGTS